MLQLFGEVAGGDRKTLGGRSLVESLFMKLSYEGTAVKGVGPDR